MSLQLSSMEQLFFLERDPGKSVTFCFSVELYEEVNPARLKEAAEITVGFFPRLREKPVLTREGKLILRPNSLPAPVFGNTDKPLLLGSAETNGYLYAIRACGRKIFVTFSHAVADVGAADAFLRQLIYEYFCLSGEEIPAEGLVYTEKAPAEHLMSLEEAIAAYQKQNPSLIAGATEVSEAPALLKPSVEIYSEWPLFGTPYAHAADLTWDNGELIRAVKKLNATPFSFLSAVAAHAACRTTESSGKEIRESYGYSMRKFLNVPSQCSFTVPVEISYEPGASLPETLREIQTRMEAAGALENLLKNGKINETYADMMVNSLDMRRIVSITEKLRSQWKNVSAETFYFANLGILRFPSRVQEKIRSCSIMPNPQKKVTDLYSSVYNGTGILRTVINSEKECLLQHVSDIMKDYDINCTYHEIGKTLSDRVDVLQFERE